MVEIPAAFAWTCINREGEAGRAWIAALPHLVDDLLRRWDCTPSAPVMHGKVGIILPVRRPDRSRAVLKVSFPHPGNVYEPHAFAVWGGRGAVLLYERDDANFAMLLEEADPTSLGEMADVDRATATLGQLARRLAVPAPPELPRLSGFADEWEKSLREDDEKLGHPLSQRAVSAAIGTLRELGHCQPETLVHGDLHFGNVLGGAREPWLVVDPKGYVGDVAYDAPRVLVGGAGSLRRATDLGGELRRRLAIFADAAETDHERAIHWTQAQVALAAHHNRKAGAPSWIVDMYERVAELLA